VRGRRIAVAAAVLAGAGLWAWAALLLWRTSVPAVRPPRLDAAALFGTGLLERTARYERLLRLLVLLLAVAQAAALALVARSARRLRLGLGRVGTGLVLAALSATAAWAVALPVHVVALWWRRRHGISAQPYHELALGQLVSLATMTAVVCVGVAAALALAAALGRGWWIPGAALAVTAALAAVVVGGALTNGPAPRALRALEHRLAVRVDVAPPRLVVTPPPRRLRTANAEAVGVGPTRRVVLWRTILRPPFDHAEVRFVLAHELSHHARSHVWKGLAWLALLALPVLALVDLGARGLRDGALVPRALLVLYVSAVLLLPLANAISRRYETEADWDALRATRDATAAQALFVDFARTSLQQPQPPAWAHLLLDDHPTLLRRVELAEAWRHSAVSRPASRAGS